MNKQPDAWPYYDEVQQRIHDLVAKARLVERLLPGECPEKDCDNGILKIGSPKNWTTHASCHGSGRVWDEEIVEVVAKVIYDGDKANLKPTDPFVAWDIVILERQRSPWHKQARAVLSALAQLFPPAGG